MTTVEFSDQMTLKHIRSMADDSFVIQAAQVSSKGENDPQTVPLRFINALMKGRHGSPFEHCTFTFFVEVPIFIAREWFRHRMSSFNEMSGRYSELIPKFYVPNEERKMVNKGTKMKPEFVADQYGASDEFRKDLKFEALADWNSYALALKSGIAPEVARMVLPVNIYTQFYWTVNARALMNFISLRVESDASTFKSYPQIEIQMAANIVEEIFKEHMPLTHEAFVANGRVAP